MDDVLHTEDALELLARGELEVAGRLVDASNATLLAHVTSDGVRAACVYKPVAGERPLWDFPRGTLARREVAAYRLSAGGGFDVCPPTVLRDGPFGVGSVQLWVDAGDAEPVPGAGLVDVVRPADVRPGWRRVLDAYGVDGEPVVLVHAEDTALAGMALFDAVANNADRKGGHVLRGADGHLFGVDHGLTFHDEPKLRTVLWGWAGEPIAPDGADLLRRLAALLDDAGDLARDLAGLLSSSELDALRARTADLLRSGRFPLPEEGRPLIPWPPF
ncbi:MAG: SCO1664 family protein [Actinomycetes bacterium]